MKVRPYSLSRFRTSVACKCIDTLRFRHYCVIHHACCHQERCFAVSRIDGEGKNSQGQFTLRPHFLAPSTNSISQRCCLLFSIAKAKLFPNICWLQMLTRSANQSPRPDSRACPFCSAHFSRVDAAKRHAKRCPERQGRSLPEGKRGRRPKACDQCWRVKLHCNALRGAGACQRCETKGLTCTLYRCDATQPSPADSPSSKHPRDEALGGDNSVALSFLLNFTDDKQDFVTESEAGLEPDDEALGSISGDGCGDGILDFMDPSILLLFDPDLSVADSPANLLDSTRPFESEGSSMPVLDSEDAALSARLDLLTLELASCTGSSPCSSHRFDSIDFRQFCNIAHVREHAAIFCRKRHYRYPIIH